MFLCIRKGPALWKDGERWRSVDLVRTVCGKMTGTRFLKGGHAHQVPVMAVAVINAQGHEYAATGKALYVPKRRRAR